MTQHIAHSWHKVLSCWGVVDGGNTRKKTVYVIHKTLNRLRTIKNKRGDGHPSCFIKVCSFFIDAFLHYIAGCRGRRWHTGIIITDQCNS